MSPYYLFQVLNAIGTIHETRSELVENRLYLKYNSHVCDKIARKQFQENQQPAVADSRLQDS